jgi:outer membrane protein OmpU
MRKILLATTALIGVAFAGAAHAAAPASPISLNVGGYNDFIAGLDNGGTAIAAGGKAVKRNFEDEFKIAFDALGKASNGVEYGANVSLWNGAEVTNTGVSGGDNDVTNTPWAGGHNTVQLNSAYVWLSGAFGKAMFGDEHGASDLFVYAPTVGEGQIDGRYMDFVSSATTAAFAIRPSGFDNTEHSTKITYYTPKVGSDTNKVQLGVSYAPSLYNYGQNLTATSSANVISPYQDIVEGVAQYTGSFKPVNVTASAQWIHGGNGHAALNTTAMGGANNVLGTTVNTPGGVAKSFNAWGLGTQVAFNGFTLGGAYNSLGDYNTVETQNRAQNSFNLGGKYEFDKVGVALSYIHGKGYDNLIAGGTAAGSATNYVSRYNAAGAGATYTWFPGLTSNIDGVLFGQEIANPATAGNGTVGGYTLLVSQRLAF